MVMPWSLRNAIIGWMSLVKTGEAEWQGPDLIYCTLPHKVQVLVVPCVSIFEIDRGQLLAQKGYSQDGGEHLHLELLVLDPGVETFEVQDGTQSVIFLCDSSSRLMPGQARLLL